MNKQKGITLIALIITIIVLLILAGVSIATLTGENGILKKAQLAKEITDQKQEEENNILKQYEDLLGIEGNTELPDNTETTEAGTIVKLPNKWLTTIPDEVSTDNGSIVIPSKKIANVYAVSDGTGNTVPVPYGFYYVGGKVESGVVISDNATDKNSYGYHVKQKIMLKLILVCKMEQDGIPRLIQQRKCLFRNIVDFM